MSRFSFSVSKGFATSENITELTAQITQANFSASVVFINPYGDGDAVDILFDGTLNANESLSLHNIVTSWDTGFKIQYEPLGTILIQTKSITNTTYKRYGSFGYLGTDQLKEIVKITAIAYKDPTASQYCIRIFDLTNGNIVSEGIFDNNEENIVDLGPVNNLPSSPSVFEVQSKKLGGNSSDKAYIEVVTFYT